MLIALIALTVLLALAIVALLLRTPPTQVNSALQVSEERYRNVVEAQTDLICRYLPDTTLTFVNEAYCRYFGRTREQLIGTRFIELMPERDRAKSLDHIQSLIAHPRTEPFTHEVLQSEDKIGWQQWIDHVITDSHGRVVEIQAIGRDVTQLKVAEAETVDRREQITHSTRVAILGQLSSALAQDLTQPLTAILCNAQAAQLLLRRAPIDIEEMQSTLGDIVADNARVSGVITRLHVLLKRNTLVLEPVDVAHLTTEVLDLARGQLVERHIAVIVELAPGLPAVLADRVQLQQVLLNLVSNAMDAMSQNSPQDRKLTVSMSLNEARLVVVSVVDNGCGITPQASQRLFEPFVTTKLQGMGLGLAICRSIVAAHGGDLRAHNNAGPGATFTFSLPVEAQAI